MQAIQGIAVSPGVAIGEALVIDHEGLQIPRRRISREAIENEVARLRNAISAVAARMQEDCDSITTQLGEKYGAIFSVHLQMLRDERLNEEFEKRIQEDRFSPEYAVSHTLQRYVRIFQELNSTYHRERAHDILDIEKSLLHSLLGSRRLELSQLKTPAIVLAHNLTPSETANLSRTLVHAFATEIGGALGHTAIVAKGLEIPAVVGLGVFLGDVSSGDLVVVDGDHGCLILQPDEDTLARYKQDAEEHRTLAARLTELRHLPAETLDGTRIEVLANIEFPHEVSVCLERGAQGIGLYRTEFLYLGSADDPTEEDHYRAYAQVVEAMSGRPVVIRTLDLGADKMGHLPLGEDEQNPVLGLRSIRLSLKNVGMFRTQLRAILRASTLGRVQLMFPMISTLEELRKAKTVLNDAREDLEEQGFDYDRRMEVGMMVEVPSAVMMIDVFLREVDFISLGTNDLAQYTLAVDRSNRDVAHLYQAVDPAVLRLIDQTIRACVARGVPAGVCGQMSGSPAYAILLLGLGFRGLSVPPGALLEIKRLCRSISLTQCQAVAARALGMENAREIDMYLHEELRRAVPELAPY